jgi:hypothetical protein
MPSLDPIYKSPFMNAMLRLSSKSGIYPKTLVQNSVTIEGSNPLTAGQFCDVWKGTFHGQEVAIKILRPYGTSTVSQHVKVGFSIFLRRFLAKQFFLENPSGNAYLATAPSHQCSAVSLPSPPRERFIPIRSCFSVDAEWQPSRVSAAFQRGK